MSTLTDEQRKRIKEIRWAIDGKRLDGIADLSRDDLKLLAKRLNELDFEEHASSEELMKWALERLKEDRERQREWLAECIEQIRIAELCLTEADRAVTAVQALVDGEMFVAGDEINKRWDAVAEDYRARGWLLPLAEEPVTPEPEPPPPVIEEPPAIEPPLPPELVAQLSTAGRVAVAQPPAPQGRPRAVDNAGAPVSAQQEESMFAALKVAAGSASEIQVSLKILSAASGVAQGSTLHVLRRLADAGRIEIISDVRAKGVRQPSTYRFLEQAPAAKPQPDPPPAPRPPEPPKVTNGSALRDRIVHALASDARSSMSLASLLDVKELAVCQTLTAMQHEGRVEAGPMPEAGRRDQQWHLCAAH